MGRRMRVMLLAVVAGMAMGQATPLDKAAKDKLVGEINHAVASTDPAQLDVVAKDIKELVAHGEMPSSLMGSWLPALVRQRRNDDLAEITLAVLMATPDATNGLKLMDMRVTALLALDKPAEALVSAKMAYNVCAMADAEKAMALVSKCLEKMHPDDKTIARRFRLEQAEGSGAPKEGEVAKGMLKDVTIDGAAFAEGLENWKAKAQKFADKMKYGNLLLVADQGAEAEKVFREMFATEGTPKEHASAAEAVARALKAQDGMLGRANVWLASVNEK